MIAFAENSHFEQYFFAGPTLNDMCDLLGRHERPVVVGAPVLGQAMQHHGRVVTTLDTDERFGTLQGFIKWNIRRPTPLAFRPDLIICDPPFFGVSLPELFAALRLLSGFDTSTKVAVSYLSARGGELTRACRPFNLESTSYRPAYVSSENAWRTPIELFANFEDPLWSQPAQLRIA